MRKPKKPKQDSIIPHTSLIQSFLNEETYPELFEKIDSSPESNKNNNPLVSDEEEQLFLTPTKNHNIYKLKSDPSFSNMPSEKASAYFLMFCNICRSFIAIGILAVPFSLSRSGKYHL